MRKLGLVIAALVATALGASAHATTFTTAQYVSAAKGLDAMKKLNLLVLGDATLHSDVEGKVYVGGNLTGNSATINKGGSPGKTAKADAKYRALTVGGNLVGSANVNNGTGLGVLEAVIGGDANSGVVMNLGAATSAKLMVGGAFNAQNFNPSTKKTALFGKSVTNRQTQDASLIKQDATLKAAGTADLKATIARQTANYTTEVLQLSQILGALTPNASLISTDQNNIHFDFSATPGIADYAVVNITAAQAAKLASGTFVMPTYAASKTLVINVAGTVINLGANPTGSTNADQQNVIWNFTDATTVNVNTALYGSVLAPKATVQGNGSPIAGSVVAKVFSGNGEVHLGTFNGSSGFLVTVPPTTGGGGHVGTPGAVPEPSSWMTMLLGFGFLGSIIRRQRRKERLAAA